MEENQQPIENLTSVNAIWLRGIYEQMNDLKQGLSLARDGMLTVEEALAIPEGELFSIQVRNIRIVLTLFDTLLIDTQPMIKKEYYNETRKGLKILKNAMDTTPEMFCETRLDQRLKNAKRKFANENFYKAIDKLNDARAGLVMELKDIFYMYNKSKESIL